MNTTPTYLRGFLVLVCLSLFCGSLQSQILASTEYKSEYHEPSPEALSVSYDRESLSLDLLRALHKELSYPASAVENCIEKKVVVHLSFSSPSSAPEIEIFRDDAGLFSPELQSAIEQVDFKKILPRRYKQQMDFYLPVDFVLR